MRQRFKMKVNILPEWNTLVNLTHGYRRNRIYFGRIHVRNFSHCQPLRSDKTESNTSVLPFKNIEHFDALKSISRKNKKLSVVEEKDIPLVESLKKGNFLYPYKDEVDKLKKVASEDAKIFFRKIVKGVTKLEIGNLEPVHFPRYTDTLIIGGGVTGLFIALALRSSFPNGPAVTVIDKIDRSLAQINFGQGIVTEQLFNVEEEIPIMKHGREFFSSFCRETHVDGLLDFDLLYDPLGSLLLADTSNAEKMLQKIDMLKAYEINNKILSTKRLKEKFPWLNVNDVLFGSLGMFNEGIVDPWVVVQGIKRKCVHIGVNFLTAEVVDFGEEKGYTRRVICKLPDGTYNSISFARLVIAGGIESLNLVELLNKSDSYKFVLNLPLEERMRYEYCLYIPNGPELNAPLIIDSDGTYFRREGLSGHYVAGVPSVVNYENFENQPYEIFDNKVKPFLMNKLPELKEINVTNGWVDVYDFCFSNEVGIAGPHPEADDIYFALGFSQHGLLCLPALGKAVSEYIYNGEYETVDLTPFHIENLWRKQHLEADRKKRELLETQQRLAITE